MASSLERTEEEEVLAQQKVPKWLESFLSKTFFGSCLIHELQKNELNRYCITCDASACRYCISQGLHKEHKVLQIYRHVYKDVVPLPEMENLIDCSQIQPYKCNKKWVVALNPLPHCGSGSQIDGNATCDTCSRRLFEPDHFRFCSITCKVEAFRQKANDGEPPFLEIETPRPMMDEAGRARTAERGVSSIRSGANQAENASKRKRRRKGVPCRAPLM